MASKATALYSVRDVIRVIRNQRVILDADLAKLYGVATKRLNQAIKRNISRFPRDFMFQINQAEAMNLQAIDVESNTRSRSQFVTLNAQPVDYKKVAKEVLPPKRGLNVKYLPYAFTEHGATMAAMVLNSPKATEMSVFIVRTFMRIREQLLASTAHAKRLAEIEKTLLTHDSALIDLYEQIRPLLLPPPEPERKRIGFCAKEKQATYRVRPSKKRRAKKEAADHG
ncbi:MAG: ORF6N domain-containing protein [Kiritimatiellaeota bacterium]|nr:ORF6N domain-containing protein [Kiritimatiellota bacterium]